MNRQESRRRFRPFAHDPNCYHIAAALPYFNPTVALLTPSLSHVCSEGSTSSGLTTPGGAAHRARKALSDGIAYKWTSRNNRKGRHAISIDPTRIASESKSQVPRATHTWTATMQGVWRMATVYPVWDISYDVAVIFTLGSVVWVINAFFVWLPLVRPATEFKNEELYGGGITAFIGATIFEIGSVLLLAEAVNENRTECFGWALGRALSHDDSDSDKATHKHVYTWRPSRSHCTHHHQNKSNLVGAPNADTPSDPTPDSTWIWFPSKSDLCTHYIHDLGFLASAVQLLAASIFWISGLTALPGIFDRLSRPLAIALYWTPQVVGGLGFVLSGALFMLETQPCWYRPAFGTLGWWVGAWNLVGGVGFALCPAFGYDERSWAQYQACLSTFWGSWAFLIGSAVQWFESLEKWPVEIGVGMGKLEGDGSEDIEVADAGR